MKKADVIRVCYAILFFSTTFVNLNLAVNNPEVINGLSGTAWLPYLGDMIAAMPIWVYGFSLYCFAAYQFLLSFLLLGRGIFVQLGMLGGIVFLLFILPFGTFSFTTLPLIFPLIALIDQDYDQSIPALLASGLKKARKLPPG